MLFWMVVWFVLVFGAWIAIDMETFLYVWRTIGIFLRDVTLDTMHFVWRWRTYVWTTIAIIGSVYGIVFITLRKRRSKKQKDAMKK